eukprot:GHVU01002009.1.p2 GENE.GHVU01002009.1~~GHVU01002009.1.p2  ORF type:complete len:142 (-),score=13.91 GHVU01002009.1:85-510(-)
MRCGRVSHTTEQCHRTDMMRGQNPNGQQRQFQSPAQAQAQLPGGIPVMFRPDPNATHADIARITNSMIAAAEEQMRAQATPGSRAAPISVPDPATVATGVPPPAPNAAWAVHATASHDQSAAPSGTAFIPPPYQPHTGRPQ